MSATRELCLLCDDTATHHDVNGLPFCDGDWAQLLGEWNEFTPEEKRR